MEKEPSPQVVGTENALTVKHEEIDTETKNINEATVIEAESGPAVLEKGTAEWLAVQPKLNAKSKSGYILFSAEVRKRVMAENPDSGFGEISRIVGIEWKKLNDEQKRQYESRAQYIAQERAKNDLLTPNSKMLQPGQVRVYLCKWTNCDFQFDCQDGLYEHIKTSHTSKIIDGSVNQYVCLWQSCLKYRKEGKPFPSLPRLHRHMKEKHLPHSSKAMLPNQRSKHYFVYIAPDESAPHGKGEAPSGHFVNHQFGTANPNAPVCTLATPLEDMQTTLTTTPARSSYTTNIVSESTPQRTVKVVNAVYQNQQNGTTQYVQQIPMGGQPVQYVTVGGQPVYQAVVVNHSQGQQPVHVYHQTPQGTIVQTQQVSNQYYQQVPQTSGNHQTIQFTNASGHPQTYQTSGHVQLQQQTPVHVSYQPSTSHSQTLPPPTPIQAPQIQPAPPMDPRNIITRAPEPIFAPVPDSYNVRRALHTKTYVTYLENLGKQRSISNWNKSLNGGEPITKDKLNMVRRAPKRKVTEEELANSLYLLRDQLLESTCGIKKCPDLKLL
uniref:HMG box domain-containing protein n=1 Tax=Panagrolaimus sp. PS1159 TaxID=55785 RepID=A0AC35FFW3_9BILA